MAYAETRAANPGALGLTIGLNAAAVVALALWNPNIFHIPKDPWTTIHVGPPPPVPPVPPEPKTQARKPVDQPKRTIETGGTIEPWHPEPIHPGPGPIDAGGGGVGMGGGTTIDLPPLPPVHNIVRRPPTMATAAGELQPPYPPALQRAEIEGSVTVRILVGSDGRPRDIVLVRADDPAFFAAAKSWGMRHWRFKAAAEDEKSVEGWYTLTVKFDIE